MLGQKTVGLLAYAGDIFIIGNNGKVKSSCWKLINIVKKVDLQIKDNKTEYIIVNRREINY